MIFVDTNILLDLLEDAATPQADWSRAVLSAEAANQLLVSNLIVAAELSGQVSDAAALGETLAAVDVELLDLDLAVAHRAGRAFADYRRRGGKRQVILPDFLIAAHAEVLDATLLTRDRGIGNYFPDLNLITPETHPHG
ncbi:type II toxin-antitoxin system VapC family toxin [Sphingomonas bacterium]|uniref:type II toxin-antitoxin system VapC family toxin n=1 Tax=Sphingomonas bacterium TaxID=1895847 RepID=UPI001576F362|nr:type II toxin-antitoxin system VapC family toxin [Sphingomonas bacterium]